MVRLAAIMLTLFSVARASAQYTVTGAAFTDPTAHDRVSMITPAPSDFASPVNSSVAWVSSTTKHLFGSFSVAGAEMSDGPGVWNAKAGCTLISPHWAVAANHENYFTRARFIDQSGNIVTVTVTTWTNVSGTDLLLVRFSTIPTNIPIIPVIYDSADLAAGTKGLFLECDRKATLCTSISTPVSGAAVSNLASANVSHDAEVGDSGKPGIVLIDNQPVLWMTGAFYGGSVVQGPYPMHHITAINAALAADGEGLTFARIGGVAKTSKLKKKVGR